MDTLINIIVGLYVLFESATALNEMNKASIKQFFTELHNPYHLKYASLGLYALLVLAHANVISGWSCLLTFPSVLCVINRTIYRVRHQGVLI